MIERYTIEEQTTDVGFKYVLIETGYTPITLGEYLSKPQAEIAKTEWIARDDLNEEMGNFTDNMLTKFGSKLSLEEIKEIIREY